MNESALFDTYNFNTYCCTLWSLRAKANSAAARWRCEMSDLACTLKEDLKREFCFASM